MTNQPISAGSTIAYETSFVAEEFAPIAYRVTWQHHGARLVSGKKQTAIEQRDFPTEEAARDFGRLMQASYPHSVVCTKPLHITRKSREARYDAKQHGFDDEWPLQRRPQR